MVTATHVHLWRYEPCRGLTSKGVCDCGATTEGRNYLSQGEADKLLMLKREVEMTAQPPQQPLPPAPQPIPYELGANDMYVCGFGFRLSAEYKDSVVERVEFSGDVREIKRLQEALKSGTVIVTLRFRGS